MSAHVAKSKYYLLLLYMSDFMLNVPITLVGAFFWYLIFFICPRIYSREKRADLFLNEGIKKE